MKKRVLIIDDDEKLNKMLSFIFKAKGFDVTSARDGINALELLEDKSPDVIILDLMMPRMDGFEFYERLSEKGIASKMPIVIISAMPYSDKLKKIVDSGIIDYLEKPFQTEELLGKVSKLVESVG